MSLSPSIEPTLEPTIMPVSQFITNDNSIGYALISYTDWKLYIAIGLFVILCILIICLIKCCKRYDKINEAAVHTTIQNNKSIHSIISQTNNCVNIRNDLHIVLDKERKQRYTVEDIKNVNMHLMIQPRTTKIILDPNDSDSEYTEDSLTFEPMTRHSFMSDAKKNMKKYKLKEEKTNNKTEEIINCIQMENEKQLCVNAVNLSFDYDLNPILYTGMSVIKPQFSEASGKTNAINEGREHSITESSTFTMKSSGVIGMNEDNIDFKMFTNGGTDLSNQHTKLMEIQSECENIVYVSNDEEEVKTNMVRLPRNITDQGFL